MNTVTYLIARVVLWFGLATGSVQDSSQANGDGLQSQGDVQEQEMPAIDADSTRLRRYFY